MSFFQSVLTMLFCMVIVFIVLIALWAVIRLFTFVIQLCQKGSANTPNSSIK